jgi:uncharacterized protein
MEPKLTASEKVYLLRLARETVSRAVNQLPLPRINDEDLTTTLREMGASFVTLTINGELRGCIGSLEPHQSLVRDVQAHAVDAALQDYRFPPLSVGELPLIKIEISRLTPANRISYDDPTQLPDLLTPGVDGVILADGNRRATFLPQVWEQLPEKAAFLNHLCSKMGSPSDIWKRKVLEVSLYQVEEFEEA